MEKRKYVLVGIVLMMLLLSTTTSLGSFKIENKNVVSEISNLEFRGAELKVTTDVGGVYNPGETITIYLTNVGDEILYGGGPLITIYNDDDEIVFEEAIYCWNELEPGEYITYTWNQKDQQGQQVTDGVYKVEGSLYGVGETFFDSTLIAVSEDILVDHFDGIEGNGCYISCVTITMLWDSEFVAKVKYTIDGEPVTQYTEPIVVCEDEDHLMEYWTVDWEGNEGLHNTVVFCIEQTPPEIEVTWGTYKVDGKWYVDFICDATDGMSGMDRVEMYINDVIHETITGPGPMYIFTIEWSKALKSCTFKFVFYDKAGNSAFITIDGSDIKSYSSSQQFTNPLFVQILQRLLNLR